LAIVGVPLVNCGPERLPADTAADRTEVVDGPAEAGSSRAGPQPQVATTPLLILGYLWTSVPLRSASPPAASASRSEVSDDGSEGWGPMCPARPAGTMEAEPNPRRGSPKMSIKCAAVVASVTETAEVLK
jgi:hypothetical protein